MRLRLLSVGKPKNPHAAALHDDYAGRIRRFGVDFVSSWVAEERAGGRFSDEHVREREAARLRERLDRREQLVVLDRRGEALESEALASRLARWANSPIAVVIGGPLGLHGSMLERATLTWSLGPLTLPHELARVVAVEQLYRALTVMHGVPYHK